MAEKRDRMTGWIETYSEGQDGNPFINGAIRLRDITELRLGRAPEHPRYWHVYAIRPNEAVVAVTTGAKNHEDAAQLLSAVTAKMNKGEPT